VYVLIYIGITNLRGKDIKFNPVFFAFAVLFINDSEKLSLYVRNKDKFSDDDVKKHLAENNITICDYNEIYSLRSEEYTIVTDKVSVNQNLYLTITTNDNKYEVVDQDPIEHTKYIKTEHEINGMRNCQIRDGAAVVSYFAWLENEVNSRDVSEYEGGLKVGEFRSKQDLYIGESFYPISSCGANAAIIHYKPDESNSTKIDKDKIYLLDNGGQFLYIILT
jgi:Xaa-Pro aminopeptidase